MIHAEMSDEKLIYIFQNGNASVLDEIYKRFYKFAFNVSNQIFHNYQSSEEAAQESFIKLKDKIYTYNFKSNFKPWFYVFVKRLAIDIQRKSKAGKKFIETKYLNIQKNKISDLPIDQLIKKKEIDRVNEAVKNLDEPYKELFVLYWFENYTSLQLSYRYNLPQGTVKNRLRTALIFFEKEFVNVKEKL